MFSKGEKNCFSSRRTTDTIEPGFLPPRLPGARAPSVRRLQSYRAQKAARLQRAEANRCPRGASATRRAGLHASRPVGGLMCSLHAAPRPGAVGHPHQLETLSFPGCVSHHDKAAGPIRTTACTTIPGDSTDHPSRLHLTCVLPRPSATSHVAVRGCLARIATSWLRSSSSSRRDSHCGRLHNSR
jgi:hypothetical protein